MNKGKLLGLALAGATFALLAAPRAEATPINYTFQVNVTSGPLAPETVNGTFAYDSTSVTPGTSNRAAGLLTALDFTFDGTTYDATTANTGDLVFNAAGDLTDFLFGTTCDNTGCTIVDGIAGWLANPGSAFPFSYSVLDGSPHWFGDVTFAKVAAVPEPGSLALLGIGLLGFGIAGFTLRRCAA